MSVRDGDYETEDDGSEYKPDPDGGDGEEWPNDSDLVGNSQTEAPRISGPLDPSLFPEDRPVTPPLPPLPPRLPLPPLRRLRSTIPPLPPSR